MEWIDVNKKLPKKDIDVMVASRKMTNNDWLIHTAYLCQEEEIWFDSFSDIRIDSSQDFYYVLFWQPMPKAPKQFY